MNKAYELIITGVGCEDKRQSTAPIEVKTETFSNGVISLADTNKINSQLGTVLKFTKCILIVNGVFVLHWSTMLNANDSADMVIPGEVLISDETDILWSEALFQLFLHVSE